MDLDARRPESPTRLRGLGGRLIRVGLFGTGGKNQVHPEPPSPLQKHSYSFENRKASGLKLGVCMPRVSMSPSAFPLSIFSHLVDPFSLPYSPLFHLSLPFSVPVSVSLRRARQLSFFPFLPPPIFLLRARSSRILSTYGYTRRHSGRALGII